MSEPEELASLRLEIDTLDYQIHNLLNRRGTVALNISKVKKSLHPFTSIFRPEREKVVIENVRQHNRGPFPTKAIVDIFENIIKHSRELQKK